MKQLFLILITTTLFSGLSNAQTVPNGNFETWSTRSYTDLNMPWITSNTQDMLLNNIASVTKVTGQTGSAIHLETYVNGKDTIVGQALLGPIPYSQNPTGISGYFRSNIVSKDTGWLFLEFLQGGNPIAIEALPFVGSVSTFTQFNFPFSFALTPDTVVIALSSSNQLFNNVGVSKGSWLEFDQLAFNGTGITQQIPDGGFESWKSISDDIPAGWQIVPQFSSNSGVTKSTDAHQGSSSIKILAVPKTFGPQVTSGTYNKNGGFAGGQPYKLKIDTLTGYYKYTGQGGDNGLISLNFQKNGALVLDTAYLVAPATNWTYFEVPFHLLQTPDTLRIDLTATLSFAGKGGSILQVDDLQMKSDMPKHNSGINNNSNPDFNVSAFPDPAGNQLFFKFNNVKPTDYNLKIYNQQGRLLLERNDNTANSNSGISLETLSEGIYFYEVAIDGSTVRNKFIKGR